MPKDQRERSLSLESSRFSPYPRNSRSKQPLLQNPLEDDNNRKQWEEARCPVCIEHPHNAILLICSSHEKGCRPFMCDTSYRHSNCFDQFRKLSSEGTETLTEPKLSCPLCRGEISHWIIVDSARCFMNSKPRTCACDSCDYSGTYKELRKHARSVHPLSRPAVVDPEKLNEWSRLERERDLGDLLSTLQSMGSEERNEERTLAINEGDWLTVFFLVQFMGPGNRSRLREETEVGGSLLRRLWGESEGDGGEGSSGQSLPGRVFGQVPRRVFRRRRYRQDNDADNQ